MEPNLNQEIIYEEYREQGLDQLPDPGFIFKIRVETLDGEMVCDMEYMSEESMQEDTYKRDFAIRAYRKMLASEQYGERD